MNKRDQNDFSSSSFSRVVCLAWSGSANTETIILTPWPTKGTKQDPEYEGEKTHTVSERSCQLECNGEGRSATIWPADTLLLQVQSHNVRAWEWEEAETRGEWRQFQSLCELFKSSVFLNVDACAGRGRHIICCVKIVKISPGERENTFKVAKQS